MSTKKRESSHLPLSLSFLLCRHLLGDRVEVKNFVVERHDGRTMSDRDESDAEFLTERQTTEGRKKRRKHERTEKSKERTVKGRPRSASGVEEGKETSVRLNSWKKEK